MSRYTELNLNYNPRSHLYRRGHEHSQRVEGVHLENPPDTARVGPVLGRDGGGGGVGAERGDFPVEEGL